MPSPFPCSPAIRHMMTSFPFLQQGNVKKCKKLRKILDIEEENCTSFEPRKTFY